MNGKSLRPRAALLALAAALTMVATHSATVGATSPKVGKWGAAKFVYGSNLKFEVKKNRIVNISASVLEKCDGDFYTQYATFAPDRKWNIGKSGTFGGRKKEVFDFGYGPVTVLYWFNGKFTSKATAKGFLRMQTTTGANCDTLKLKWTAKRGG